MTQDLTRTRRSLHAVAELLLAGPQYDASGTIRLRVVPGGFATTAAPDVRVAGVSLLALGASEPMTGRSPRELAAAVGVAPRSMADVYSGGSGMGVDERLALDDAQARLLLGALALGDAALREWVPDAEPVLWPEHFDVGVTVREVLYGVSPGDGYLSTPYCYVSPGTKPPADAFWAAPFGAARALASLTDAAAVRDFFTEGRDRLDR